MTRIENSDLISVIRLCRDMDSEARKTYTWLAGLCESPGLSSFWQTMAGEELQHVKFWNGVLELAVDGLLPPIADNLRKTVHDLEEANRAIVLAVARCEKDPTVANMFVLAFRIECALLHPAIAAFFHYMRSTGNAESPEATYERHLRRFIEKIREVGAATPELDLVGDALLRLWTDNRHLAFQSSRDELTGVMNRRGWLNAIRPFARLAQRSGAEVGVVMVDVDGFKGVNDTKGHLTGDAVLRRVAGLIEARMRRSDLVGRYGGDEFVIFLSDVKGECLRGICESVRERVEHDATPAVPVTVSVGGASGRMSVDADAEIMRLIDSADQCLLLAKQNGRNRAEVPG